MKKLLLVFLLFPFLSFAQTNDLAVDSVFHRMGVGGFFPDGLDYYKISEYQRSPINFSAIISNEGTNDLTGCFLTAQISNGTSIVYENTSDTVDLLSGVTDSIFLSTSYTPPAWTPADYTVKYWINSDSLDDNNSNDTLYSFFELTEYQYSRSNGLIQDTLMPTDLGESLGLFGNIMYAHEETEINAVDLDIYIDPAEPYQLIFSAVFILDSATNELYYEAQTSDYDINVSGHYTFYYDGPAQICAGKYFCVFVGCYWPTTPFLFAQNAVPNSSVFLGEDGSFHSYNDRILAVNVHTDAGYNCQASIKEIQSSHFQLNQNTPNPFKENTTISYFLEQPANVSLVVTDQVGKVVYSESHGQQLGGDNSILLDCNDWSSGIYFYTLIVDGEKQTKRMILK